MSTPISDSGVWGLVEERLGSEGEGDGSLWGRLGTLVDPGEYRPKLDPDIEIKKFTQRSGEDYYMLANPRDLVHYRIQGPDYELVRLMDGTRTLKEIVIERFSDSGEMDVGGVADFVYQLRSENFFEDRFENVEAVVHRALNPPRRHDKLRQFVTNLRIEWKNPQAPVKWLYDHGFRYALTKPFVLLALGVAIAGIFAFVANYRSHLFGLTGKSLAVGFFVLLAIQYFMILVHELGHALVLVDNGRRLKGAGFLIYFGCPAFYVESSDSLMMEPRKRVLQAFAGPYGQSFGAGVASIIAWAYPQWVVSETLFRYTVLAYLNIFLNLIPILELDGYFMLSDWLRVPDLRPRSVEFLRHDFLHKLRTRERFTRVDVGLLIYGLLGVVGSILLLISGYIFWKILFGGLVISMWNGGIETRIILILLGLFVLNPVLRGSIRVFAAIGRRIRALGKRVRFRIQRRWRVEAAEMIDRLSLFEDVPEEALSELAGRVRLRSFSAGQPVVRQGERAQAFYVVRNGVLRVVEEDPATGEELRTLRSLGRGESFGEVGLAEAAPRTATVRAADDVDVFEIDKGTFGELLADILQAPRFAPTMQAVADLRKMASFSHLETDELVELVDQGEWINVAPGETVVEEGEEGDAFFAISSGQVEVSQNGRSIRTMGPGAYFGEIALLLDVPRTATVRAITPVRAFRLGREGFDKLIRDSFHKGTMNPVISLDRVEEH
ncbi:MAG TPA: cyclic nucleotide-binding domain-containing protein [Actinomycetota bacterium]